MISLNPRTGANDRFVNLHISGHVSFPHVAGNPTRVFNQQISHSGRLDLVEGDFSSVGGKRRQQVFMLNLASRPAATVMSWTSPRFDGSKGYPPKGYYYNCNKSEPFYVRAGAWSPDDKTVYLASTGYRPVERQLHPAEGVVRLGVGVRGDRVEARDEVDQLHGLRFAIRGRRRRQRGLLRRSRAVLPELRTAATSRDLARSRHRAWKP